MTKVIGPDRWARIATRTATVEPRERTTYLPGATERTTGWPGAGRA